MLWGVTGSWTLCLSAVIGAWLMFSPAVFGSLKPAADSDHLIGAMVVTLSMIALAEVGRTARYAACAPGAKLDVSLPIISNGPRPTQRSARR